MEKELIKVLSYHKFGLTPIEMLPILDKLRKNAIFIQVNSKIDIIKDDLSDNIFLECAIDGNANFIVSGDKHLLLLKEYQGIIILSPSEFLNLI
jgi:putative PIN family toxin of toxin-antitoxin system